LNKSNKINKLDAFGDRAPLAYVLSLKLLKSLQTKFFPKQRRPKIFVFLSCRSNSYWNEAI